MNKKKIKRLLKMLEKKRKLVILAKDNFQKPKEKKTKKTCLSFE